MTKEIVENIGQIISYAIIAGISFFAGWLKKQIPKIKQSVFGNWHVISDKAADLVIQLRGAVDSDRAYIFMVKNGERFINGTPIYSVSMVAECVKAGVAESKGVSQNIPTYLFSDLIRKCIETGYIVVHTDGLLESSYLKTDLLSKGVRVLIMAPFFDLKKVNKNQPLGYVGASWLYTKEITNEHINYIKNYTQQIGFEISK